MTDRPTYSPTDGLIGKLHILVMLENAEAYGGIGLPRGEPTSGQRS